MKKVFFMLFCLCWSANAMTQGGESMVRDVPYRVNATDAYQRERCVVDVYTPAVQGAELLPVVVWFHGGGLTGGNKEVPASLRGQGLIVVGVNYRLSPKVKVESIVDDAAAAVDWVFRSIKQYGGDTERVYVAGHSAGGYLVAMITLDKHYLAKYGTDANRIAGCLPYSGQMVSHFTYRQEQQIPALRPTIDAMAPIYHLRSDAPPMVLTTGDREKELYGRYEETAYFYRMALLNGMKCVRLYEFEGTDHGSMCEPAHEVTLKYLQGKMGF